MLKPYSGGNSQNSIQFIKVIRGTHPNQKIIAIWDGVAASHNSDDFRKINIKSIEIS